MHDFNCRNADDMFFKQMAEKTRYLKETEEGVRTMSKAFDEWVAQEREEAAAIATILANEKARIEIEQLEKEKRLANKRAEKAEIAVKVNTEKTRT